MPLTCASVLHPFRKEHLLNKIALDILVYIFWLLWTLLFKHAHTKFYFIGLSYTVIWKHTDYKFSRLLKLPDLDLFTFTISLVTCINQNADIVCTMNCVFWICDSRIIHLPCKSLNSLWTNCGWRSHHNNRLIGRKWSINPLIKECNTKS